MKTYKDKIKTIDMEIAVARYINFSQHLIVPNVSFGMGFRHELDMLVLTNSGYLWEVEIKVSLADLKKDKDKWHGHHSSMIKDFYFAIPSCLVPHTAHIPERAGILVVSRNASGRIYCSKIRKPKTNRAAPQMTDRQRYKLARLGVIRLWTVKKKLRKTEKQMALWEESE